MALGRLERGGMRDIKPALSLSNCYEYLESFSLSAEMPLILLSLD